MGTLEEAALVLRRLQRAHHALLHAHLGSAGAGGETDGGRKERRRFQLRKKKSTASSGSLPTTAMAPPSPAAAPPSLPAGRGAGSGDVGAGEMQAREQFLVLADDLLDRLGALLRRARGSTGAAGAGGASASTDLRAELATALANNAELQGRLARIHEVSASSPLPPRALTLALALADKSVAGVSASYSASCVSGSEFYDAEDLGARAEALKGRDEGVGNEEEGGGVIELEGDTSSEAGSLSSGDASNSSDTGEGLDAGEPSGPVWQRRTRLPAPRASAGGPSLWNLLYKNIGKDLSQISMPVSLNEPLNVLQRLAEELEYAELLESAAACARPEERGALVLAFAVSAYAAVSRRAASKPFNPLLHETYECVRPDRAFRFLAEQVSHHPPVSACHAHALHAPAHQPAWTFWQEARVKTKFWGKSMEVQPVSRVHVQLRVRATGEVEHYTWNKVTSCVHNVFVGARSVEHYGTMSLRSDTTQQMRADVEFLKGSGEVRGALRWAGGTTRISGRWAEALLAGDPPAARTLWRPGAMPPESEAYYGFTRFAMELNELEPGMEDVLPHTDTRFRPDQRLLEVGEVEQAEAAKLRLEQAQRDRRKLQPDVPPAWFARDHSDGEGEWVFAGQYWAQRELGFPDLNVPRLW